MSTIDKNQLKLILKPLIMECVKQTIFESGMLSSLITEVVKGLQPLLVEQKQSSGRLIETADGRIQSEPLLSKQALETREALLNEKRQRAQQMMEKTGLGHIFKDIVIDSDSETVTSTNKSKQKTIVDKLEEKLITEPLSEKEKIILKEEIIEKKKILKHEQIEESKYGASGGTALRGQDPNDPGVNIAGIINVAGGTQKWKSFMKGKK